LNKVRQDNAATITRILALCEAKASEWEELYIANDAPEYRAMHDAARELRAEIEKLNEQI
jgi:hypothetical protein